MDLLAGNGYNVDDTSSAATATIYNNDLPTASITAQGGGSSGQFTVTRNGPTGEPLLVNYTERGTGIPEFREHNTNIYKMGGIDKFLAW